MNIFKQITLVLLIITLTFSVGCTKKQTEITMGELNNTVYTNNYFGLSFKIPKDWFIATDEEKDQLSNAGKDVVSGDDDELKKQLELSKEKTLNLLFAFKHSLNYVGGVNSNFMCIAENIALDSIQIKNGDDYLFASQKLMEQAGLPYEFSQFTTEKLGNKEFSVMNAVFTYDSVTVKQKIYSSVINDYALNFTITYANDEEYEELNSILQSIKFK